MAQRDPHRGESHWRASPGRDNGRDPKPWPGHCSHLKTPLTHNREKGVRRKLSELQRYSQGPLGVSINLQIYLKLSKFTMTNVTVPLNWSSSLGSLGALEEVPATGTWKEINLQIPWKHRELLWKTYGGSHTAWKKKAYKCQRCRSNVRRMSAVHAELWKERGAGGPMGCGKLSILNLCCSWEEWGKKGREQFF